MLKFSISALLAIAVSQLVKMGVDLGVSSDISSSALAVLRGILVKSLSRENLSLTDQHLLATNRKSADRHVSFKVGKD